MADGVMEVLHGRMLEFKPCTVLYPYVPDAMADAWGTLTARTCGECGITELGGNKGSRNIWLDRVVGVQHLSPTPGQEKAMACHTVKSICKRYSVLTHRAHTAHVNVHRKFNAIAKGGISSPMLLENPIVDWRERAHLGTMGKAKSYLSSIAKDDSISTIMEHLRCLVDPLGRSGKLDEASVEPNFSAGE
ncbi:hypothetical protein SELMODRAFT_424598 [Selaginella moellendorffii]|uniref:Uncharacterized protein n=1 Tax=Selaginella moellendorffii TaxID=88036 RepID=D8SQF4_SELML|nr:hypothetical protein SELMODRAFT_424598 [Selaginella moellendorffii]